MTARHFKYTYKSEIPPKIIFSRMKETNIDDSYIDNNESNRVNLNIERNRIYFSRRKEIKNLMKLVNTHINNNSQTLFLTLYYMDIIFTHKDLEKVFYSHFKLLYNNTSSNDIQMNNYVLLSLACLIIASKFIEIDPHVPTMSSFIRLLYQYSKKKYIFNLDSIYMAEVVVIKLLKYKLNYYTIYHYLVFFFTHGIVFKKSIEDSKIYKKYSERKILEKIYIQARDIIDGIIEQEKYFNIYFGKDNYKVVVEILLWSIEHIINISIKDDENIFKLVFNINIDEDEHKKIYEIIEHINKYNKKTNTFGSNSTKMEMINTKNIKNISNNINTKISDSINIFSAKSQSNESDLKKIEQKQNESNEPLFSNVKSNILFSSKINLEKHNQYCNELIKNKIDRYNANQQYKILNSKASMIKQESLVPQSTIKYGPNNRIYLTSNKNLTTSYQLSLIDNNNNENFTHKNNNSQNKNKKSFNIDNLSNDINKIHNNNIFNNFVPIENTDKIDINSRQKIIIVNDSIEDRKQLFSIFNMSHNNNHNNYQPKPSTNFNDNIETKLKIEDHFKNQNELIKQKRYNNYNFTPNKNKYIEENLKKEHTKNIPFKKFKSLDNGNPIKFFNGNYLSDKNVAKFMDITFIKKPKDKSGIKIMQNLKIEQVDKRGSMTKYYYDKKTKNSIIKY